MEGEEVYRIKVKLECADVVDYDPVSVYNCLQFDSVFSTPGESPGSWSFRFSSFSENNLDDCGLELKNLSKKLGKTKAKFCDKIFGSNAFGDLYIEVPKNGKELRVMKMGRQKSKTDISVFSEEEFTSFFMPDGSVCCLNFYHKRGLLLSSDLTRRTNFEITILGRRNCDYFFTPEGIVYLTTNYGVNSLFSSRWVSSPGAILAPEE